MNPFAWLTWVFGSSHLGRLGRIDYLCVRLSLLLLVIPMAALLFISGQEDSAPFTIFSLVAIALLTVIFIYRGLTADIQRLHDMDLSGWWVLLGFILNGLGLLLLLIIPGTHGPNRFDLIAPKKARTEFAKPVKTAKTIKGPASRNFAVKKKSKKK